MQFISMDEYLMGRIKLEQLTAEQLGNMNTLVPRANELLEKFGEYRKVTSGYRTPADQERINPKAPQSKHLVCAAVDLEDHNNKLKTWCLAHLPVLEKLGLWMESPVSTPTWVHVQCVAPTSGHRVFIP